MVRAAVAAGVLFLAAAAATMQLRSTYFSADGVIPRLLMAVDCGGTNRSPELHWSAVPDGTKSFALILHDPDAPVRGGFYHWVVYNLPITTERLAGGVQLDADQLGQTTNGRLGYYGPCPPPGPAHHYIVTLYALDLAHVTADAPLSAAELKTRIAGHVLARATLHATASHP